MSIAAPNYDAFRRDLAKSGRVFTFTDDGELLVHRKTAGEVVPFWSSLKRIETVQRNHPKYKKWTITEFSLSEFISWLDQLHDENVAIGANWSGARLIGYDVSADDVRRTIAAQRPSSEGSKKPPHTSQ